jgi:hypothetical protein
MPRYEYMESQNSDLYSIAAGFVKQRVAGPNPAVGCNF